MGHQNKLIVLLYTIFAIIHAQSGDYAAEYQGMDADTIARLAQERGETITFVDRNTYIQFVEAKDMADKAKADVPDTNGTPQ